MIRRLATLLLRLGRWTIDTPEGPADRRYIVLAAPHTSFWDGLWTLLYGRAADIPLRFVIKAEHLRGPFAPIRWLGAVPVEPGKNQKTTEALRRRVEQMVADGEDFALLIAPAGTRSHRDRWRSGFYHLARDTGLPVHAAYLDYGARRIGLAPGPVPITGDVRADMDVLRGIYADTVGHHPEDKSTIVLREELEAPGA